MDLSPAPSSKPRVALLIDGENIPPSAAGQIVLKAQHFGEVAIRRVYGNVAKLGGWSKAPGIRPIHSGSGKNATDLLMSVEAMSFLLDAKAEVLVLATSDRDFAHLATHLRERSVRVIGIGEKKAPENFRQSCSSFIELKIAGVEDEALANEDLPAPSDLDATIEELVQEEGEAGAFPISNLGGRMHALHQIKISDLEEKSWRAYLLARPHLYDCDARGPDAKLRLKV
ncbi:NYN domain-containing protein [Tabrizicola sp.]|uniref:NYN domain-containing protein n=1 Tax=Tabrizicola sp. TaxID=2005166 RepID=UPI003F348396